MASFTGPGALVRPAAPPFCLYKRARAVGHRDVHTVIRMPSQWSAIEPPHHGAN
jgi:hypothetical protein